MARAGQGSQPEVDRTTAERVRHRKRHSRFDCFPASDQIPPSRRPLAGAKVRVVVSTCVSGNKPKLELPSQNRRPQRHGSLGSLVKA